MADDRPDDTDLFDVVSDGTRVDVLEALANAHGESPADPWVSYSDLRAAVGVRDKGRFNYHLDRLGDLVVDGESGYRISRAGMAVVSAVASGEFDPEWTWGPVEAPGECGTCGDPLQLRYENGVLRLSCGTDGHGVALSASPSFLESQPEEELFERLAALVNQWGPLVRRGICSECQGRVDASIERYDADHYHLDGRCRRCGFRHGIPVGLSLVGHPAVVAFYHDHGVDVRARPFWTLDFTAPGSETVVSTDPLRLRVDVRAGDEVLALTVGDNGDVVTTERSSAPVDGDEPGTQET